MNNQVTIDHLDPVYSKCTQGKDLIKECLSYRAVYYRASQYRKIRKEYPVYLINKQGIFFSGLIETVQEFCERKKINLQVNISETMKQIDSEVQPLSAYELPGIALRPDQERLVQSALTKRKGVIVGPTGMGKTIIMLSIAKAFEDKNILILVPTLALLKQTVDEMRKFGFQGISTLGDGIKEFYGTKVVSTIQTFVRLDLEKYGHVFDCVFVDEGHKAINNGSTIQKILSQLFAPVKIAFTATPPQENTERGLILTGLTGPIIDRVTWLEGKEIGMLADPKLILIPIPKSAKISEYNTYRDIYRVGITENQLRNRIIIREAKKLSDQNQTSLIFVVEIDHGQNLFDIGISNHLNCKYINGNTDSNERNKIKKQLEKKEIDSVITTVIFREGINIPTLNAIILAHGGKGETALLQTIGRGLRRTEDKEIALIYDTIDIGKYLSEHFAERMCIYHELGLV
jgi:superfamily II DNA or RNA helicase